MNFNPYTPISTPYSMGKTVYIIGASSIGTPNVPVFVTDLNDCINKFGDINDSQLSKAFAAFWISNGGPAYLVRTNGACANVTLKGVVDGILTDVFDITVKDAGVNGNNYTVGIGSNIIEINHPGYGSGSTIFDLSTCYNIATLIQSINQSLPIVSASSFEDNYLSNQLQYDNDLLLNFTGGIDSSNDKNNLYNSLTTTLDLLVGTHIDLLLLADMFFDDIIPTAYIDNPLYGQMYYVDGENYLDITAIDGTKCGFHKQLIQFALNQNEAGIYTHCIMGTRMRPDPLPNGYDPAVMMMNATALKSGDGIRDTVGTLTTDYGKHLSVCYGEAIYYQNTGNEFQMNWYMSYAALWIFSNYNDSLTGMVLPSGMVPINNFDNTILTSLTDMGVVTYRKSPLKDWCVTAGITCALYINPMYLVSNIKIVQRCISMLNSDIDTYLMNPTDPIITNSSLGVVVEKSLETRRDIEKILRDFNFKISYDSTTGVTTINIDLFTVYSAEKITAGTSIFTK